MPKTASAPVNEKVLNKLREICLALPETTETLSWGKPHFKVAGKIFLGCREEEGRTVIGLLLEMGHAQKVIEDSRFWLVGDKGGVCMDVSAVKNWREVEALVRESYFLTAPKKLAQELVETNQSKGGSKTKQTKKP